MSVLLQLRLLRCPEQSQKWEEGQWTKGQPFTSPNVIKFGYGSRAPFINSPLTPLPIELQRQFTCSG